MKLHSFEINNKSLTSLSLSHLPLTSLSLSTPSLLHLFIDHCQELSDSNITLSLKIETLRASHIPHLSFDPFKSLPAIREMELDACGWVSDVTMTSSTLKTFKLNSCPSLESIKLDCPALESLQVTWCTKLTVTKIRAPILSRLVKNFFLRKF
jgi:hypothetical protein